MSLPRIEGAVTIVTGASSGIGHAAAREFARAGARVVLASRNEPKLRELERSLEREGREALVVPTDVTRDDQVRAMIAATLARFGRVDILICNAGVGLFSPVREIPQAALRRVFEVNFFGVVRCVQAALPSMLARESGLIQIVSSVIGLRAVPGYAGYCATKFAVGALAESLRVEVAGRGVRVQVVYPGLTATAFPQNSILPGPEPRSYPVPPMSADRVGRIMVRAARRGSRDQVISAGGRLLTLLDRLSPALVDYILARSMAGRIPVDAGAPPD
ncbi:MAG TPA: SDR family oxidoreductase [Candidatus Polarisedimenticolia bacterium]|jgi:short-subunit dehydrogenase